MHVQGSLKRGLGAQSHVWVSVSLDKGSQLDPQMVEKGKSIPHSHLGLLLCPNENSRGLCCLSFRMSISGNLFPKVLGY